ncbi:MAG: thioesterase family protein [Bacteroidia bacterium]
METFSHEHQVRVRYSETDQMGYVYYGNYAAYFEVGRVEAMRSLGISYRDLELQGILMPVSKYEVKFLLPCRYDELLTIRTEIKEMPHARIRFHYLTFNESGRQVNEAVTELFFLDREKQKPVRAPEILLNALKNLQS